MPAHVRSRHVLLALLPFVAGMLLGATLPPSLAAVIPRGFLPLVLAADVSQPPAPPAPPHGAQSVMLGPPDFLCRCAVVEAGSFFPATAQLHLPQGAEIVQVTLFYSRAVSVPYTTTLVVERHTFGQYEPITGVVLRGDGPLGQQLQSVAASGGRAVVDNTTYGYRVAVFLDRQLDGTNNPPPFVFYQVRVDYRLPTGASPT